MEEITFRISYKKEEEDSQLVPRKCRALSSMRLRNLATLKLEGTKKG